MQYHFRNLHDNTISPCPDKLNALVRRAVMLDELYQQLSDNDADKERISNESWDATCEAAFELRLVCEFAEIVEDTLICTEM